MFVTDRKARAPLPAADLDERGYARFSYQQAAELFSAASGGATLHQLRHPARQGAKYTKVLRGGAEQPGCRR